MASNGAELSVTLQANMATFQRQMDQAGILATEAVRNIEGAFSSANPGVNLAASVAKGTIGANILLRVFEATAGAVLSAKTHLEEMGDIAKRTGLSVQQVFGTQSALGDAGLKIDVINKGLETFGERLNQAARGENNDIAKLFAANGVAITDATGKMRPFNELLGAAADLVRNAKTEFDKIDIAKILGLSQEWVKALEPGGDALRKAQEAASAAGPDFQYLVDKAHEFDLAWEGAARNVGVYLKAAAVDFGDNVTKGLDLVLRRLAGESLESIQGTPTKIKEVLGLGGPAPDQPKPLTLTVGGRRDTTIPIKNTGASNTESDPERFFETEERQARERTARMQLEIQTLGQTTTARTTAMEALRLEQALERGGVTITDEYREKVAKLAAGFGQATQALEQAQEAQQRFQALQNFAGNTIVDVLDRATQKGADLKAIMLDVAEALKRAALQAAILGTGPLAGLFGTGGTGGQTGGLIGLLTSGLRGLGGSNPYAAGAGGYTGMGPFISGVPGNNASGTDNWRGGMTWVGEGGPELINLPRGSQVFPADVSRSMASSGGGVDSSRTYHIDARGAQAGVAEQITTALRVYDRELNRTLPARVLRADQRY